MATEHVAGKPHIGKLVHYYNSKILQRIGYTKGYGGRGEGPYAAVVTNDLGAGLTLRVYFPGIQSLEFERVPFKDDAEKSEVGHWDWAHPLDAARAAKELKADASDNGG